MGLLRIILPPTESEKLRRVKLRRICGGGGAFEGVGGLEGVNIDESEDFVYFSGKRAREDNFWFEILHNYGLDGEK